MARETSSKEADGFQAEELPKLYSIFHGQVVSVQKYGVFVSIPGYKRHGLVHVSQMSSARIEDPGEMLAKGEKVYCKVMSIETEGSKIGLSMKVVSQTTGQDLDPNNVQLSQDAKKRKQFFGGPKPPIELGAIFDTTCRKCGGHGHLAMECYVGRGSKQYELVPDLEDMVPSDPEPPQQEPAAHNKAHKDKKKKKERKQKKEKKKKKRKYHSSSSESSDEDDTSRRHHIQKKRKRQHSTSSDSDHSIKTKRKDVKKKKRRHSSSSDSHDEHRHKHRRKSSHKDSR